MAWPQPDNYQEVIQNPQYCFEDPELRAGKPALDRNDLPRPMSGQFATVYQMNCGPKKWAVRCFLNEVPDQQRRYAQINDHLKRHNLPFMVGFNYLQRGIMVNKNWYPILKMEW